MRWIGLSRYERQRERMVSTGAVRFAELPRETWRACVGGSERGHRLLRARMLAWKAMPSITLIISPVLVELPEILCIVSTTRPTTPRPAA